MEALLDYDLLLVVVVGFAAQVVDGALGMAFVSHHLIKFTREALVGAQNASFYSARTRGAEDATTAKRAA